MTTPLHLVTSLPGQASKASLAAAAIRLKGSATRPHDLQPQLNLTTTTTQDDQSRLLQLPRELLFAVLSCLSPTLRAAGAAESEAARQRSEEAVRAVANVRLTCSALYVAAEASKLTHAAVVAHLASRTRALMSHFKPAPLSRRERDEEKEDNTAETIAAAKLEAAPPVVRVAAHALRAAFAVGGRRVPLGVLDEVEKRFDPAMRRYACYVTARVVTDLPGALAVLSEGQWDEIVTKAFATPLVLGQYHDKQRNEEKVANPNPWKARNDAWTSLSSIPLGPLKHVASEQELHSILAAAYKDANVVRPLTSDVVRSLSQLVGVSPFMMWRDTTFSAASKQQPGTRFVLVGATAACVVQIEYYSNFCGGPFANYSCGMG